SRRYPHHRTSTEYIGSSQPYKEYYRRRKTLTDRHLQAGHTSHRSSLPPAPFLSAADEEIPQPRHPGSRNENKRHQESPADGRNRCRYRSKSGRYGRVAADAVVL